MSWRRDTESVDEDNPYWMSFSDMMAGLLVIFMLATLALMLQLQQQLNITERDNEYSEFLELVAKARNHILKEMKKRLYEEKEIDVQINLDEGVIHIPEAVLSFGDNDDQVRPDQREKVNAIGAVLCSVLDEQIDERPIVDYLDTIAVEGHTDARPIMGDEDGNWRLSTRRAVSVWRVFQDVDCASQLAATKNHGGESLFVVGGYAASRLLDPTVAIGANAEVHSINRRITLRFSSTALTREKWREWRDAPLLSDGPAQVQGD